MTSTEEIRYARDLKTLLDVIDRIVFAAHDIRDHGLTFKRWENLMQAIKTGQKDTARMLKKGKKKNGKKKTRGKNGQA